MLIQSELVQEMKTLLKLNQPGDGDDALAIHLSNVARELAPDFRSLFIRSTTLTPTSGVVTFPENMQQVLGMWTGTQEIQPVSPEEYQRLTSNNFISDIIKIEERAGRWIGTASGGNVSNATTFTVVYRISTDDISAYPEQYKRTIMLGAGADYFLFDEPGNEVKESRLRKRYEESKRQLREIQAVHSGEHNRRKSQFELDWNRALRTLLVANDQDVS